jgi:hypothetical protein
VNHRRAFVVLGLSAGVAAFVAIALATAEPGPLAMLNRERSPIAWLVSVLLCMAAAAALGLALSAAKPWRFGLLAAGCVGAGLDEAFMFHERLKESILFGVFEGDLDAMGVLGDLPMLIYPIAGLAIMVPLLQSPPSMWSRWLWGAALALGTLAVGGDILLPVHPWQAVEELTEVAVATCLLLGTLLAHSMDFSPSSGASPDPPIAKRNPAGSE